MYNFTIPMALMDYVPVAFFAVTAITLLRDLYNKMSKGLYTLLGITESQPGLRTLIHIMVMTLLFIVSFTVQQRWVFAADKRSHEKV